MPADDYDALKSQYHAVAQEPFSGDRVARMSELRGRLREFCMANGKDLKELDAWFADELGDWAGYVGG